MSELVTQREIRDVLKRIGGYSSIYIPEFTWGELRVDALVIDTTTRWVRGFEIKMDRHDFLRDEKWQAYTQFCSSLSIACPFGLIEPAEVPKPFGLLWIAKDGSVTWERKPKRFQRRDAMAWFWTYTKILELEIPRLQAEIKQLLAKERVFTTKDEPFGV